MFEILPSFRPSLNVVLQPLKDCFIEGPRELSLSRISIGVDDDLNVRMRCPKTIQQLNKLGIHNNAIHLRVLKDVSNVYRLQSVVDSYLEIRFLSIQVSVHDGTHQH